MKSLTEFPRVRLAHTPTPLEPLPRISEMIGGPSLWVKRDDCTGLGMGGNKARQLEFYLGEAVEKRATTVIITGAVQSNYVRSAAAAAAKLGLGCEIQLEDRVQGMDAEYRESGNVLLDKLFGATLHKFPEGENEAGADAALEFIAERVRSKGGRPYVIHLGEGHRPLGALAYIDAAGEILQQTASHDLKLAAVVVASGSGATHAGLLVGFRALGNTAVRVHGICVRRDVEAQAGRVLRAANATAEEIGCAGVIGTDDVLVDDAYLGPGYGHPSAGTLEAIALAARHEGLLLDPVYSGKAFDGALGLVRSDAYDAESEVIFVHTGGTPALFGYRGVLSPVVAEGQPSR